MQKFRIILVGLSLSLIALLSWWGITASQNEASKLFNTHFYAPLALDLLRGGAQTPADSLPTPLVEGLQSYQKAEYGKAIKSFKEVPQDRLTAFERSRLNLLSGVCFLVEAEYELCRTHLPLADMHVESADWYLALSYLRANEEKTSLELLNKIATDDAHEFQLLAKSLISDMD